MKYEMYYEEKKSIHYSEYERIKRKIKCNYGKHRREDFEIRKQLLYKNDLKDKENTYFSIEWNKKSQSCIFLKKAKYDQIYFVAKESITKEECSKIASKDILWMKQDERPLFHEFYILFEQGEIRYDRVFEYKQETYPLSDESCLYFIRRLRCPQFFHIDFFEAITPMVECISCDQIITLVKKKIRTPVLLAPGLQVN